MKPFLIASVTFVIWRFAASHTSLIAVFTASIAFLMTPSNFLIQPSTHSLSLCMTSLILSITFRTALIAFLMRLFSPFPITSIAFVNAFLILLITFVIALRAFSANLRTCLIIPSKNWVIFVIAVSSPFLIGVITLFANSSNLSPTADIIAPNPGMDFFIRCDERVPICSRELPVPTPRCVYL